MTSSELANKYCSYDLTFLDQRMKSLRIGYFMLSNIDVRLRATHPY